MGNTGKPQSNVFNGQLITEAANSRMVLYKGNLVKLLIGKDAAGNAVVKVAKDGYSADTAADANLIFNSSQDVFKIVQSLTATIPSWTTTSAADGSSLLTIPHNQKFVPIIEAFAVGYIVNPSIQVIASSYVPLPIFISTGIVNAGYWFPETGASPAYHGVQILFAVDATNIYIQASSKAPASGSYTLADIPISYFLLQETAT